MSAAPSAPEMRATSPLLEQDHGRNAADGIARRDGLLVFGVELGQAHAGFQLAGGLRKGGRHLSAGTTPRGPEVHQHRDMAARHMLVKAGRIQLQRRPL